MNVTSLTTGSINLGGATQTGGITIGISTANQTVNVATGATTSGNVKTINLGTAGAAGSQTNITVGTTLSNTLLTVNANNSLFSGLVNALTLSTGTTFIANSTQITLAVPVSSNGSVGTAGQVLTSNGATGSPYWSTTAGATPGVGTGNGSDDAFFINGQFVNTDYTTSATKNYVSAGPITLNANVTITSGSRWSIV